tara:strand:- start:78 stop:479 length:402 start_codon:yes stop_codon:yes gene_type:complete
MVEQKTNLPNLEKAKKETEEFSEEMRLKVEKAKNMDINDLRGTVLQRFQELTDEEKGIFDTIMDSPVGTVINKLVGPELDEIFSETESETDRMLADDMPKRLGARERIMPQGMPRDMPVDDMPQAMEREMASR